MSRKSTAASEVIAAPGAARILPAAERLFAQRGFAGASMHAIATAARVSKAAVFHHFRSKEALYLEVVGAASREFAEQLNATLPANAAFGRQVEIFASQQLEYMLRRSQVSRLILREMAESRPERKRRLTEKVLGANFARLLTLLREGQVAKLVRADVDCAAAACLLIAANVFFFQLRHVLACLPGVSFSDDPSAYSRLTAGVVLEGILNKRVAGANKKS